ncbi:MAG TPA: hypothetical protein VH254_01055 [Candidatus Udaeobacter sp.]|jgi:hypothetical protein|nr:hypothetical protein [Candidatus Udaeobacter sp.]
MAWLLSSNDARSNWRSAAPSFIAGLLTLPYIYGKTQGGSALARVNGYIPSLLLAYIYELEPLLLFCGMMILCKLTSLAKVN